MSDDKTLPFSTVMEGGGTLKLGDENWVIADKGVAIEFVDLVTEFRVHHGVVYLAFASAVIDSGSVPIARICCRLRMSLVQAQTLRDGLGAMIDDALKPVDQSKAN